MNTFNGSPFTRRTFLGATGGAIGLAAVGPPGLAGLPAAAAAGATGAGALETFDFAGVRLLGSRWKDQQDEVADDYLNVPSDNYLYGFRLRAGQQNVPGCELGGWYTDDNFHNFGQIISGMARLYAGSGRTELRDKVAELTTGFIECIGSDGYFFYSDSPNSKHYVYEKMMCGLLDAWLYCGVDAAVSAMETITTWAQDPLHLTRRLEHGGGWDGEWYTLSETLYRAFMATGNSVYSDFGSVWEYRSLWDQFYNDRDIFTLPPPDNRTFSNYHAYSHVNSLSGLGAGYRMTGDEYYRTALVKAYDVIHGSHTWSTGGYGPYEQLTPDRAGFAATLEPWHHHFETQCGSWAALKVSKYLVAATGQSRFGDWAEQMLYNGVGASMSLAPDGSVQYYSAYSPRGGRKVVLSPWSCCTGTRPQGVADYTDQVFVHDDTRLLVNLFLPARVDWPTGDATLRARVVTDFPSAQRVTLAVDTAPSGPRTLGFRVPGWLAAPATLRLNGSPTSASADADGWITHTREWRPGDRLEVDLPMELTAVPVLDDQPAPAGVTFGPVSVAYAATHNPVAGSTPDALVASTRRSPRGELAWTVDGSDTSDTEARPFYAYVPDELYFLHLDPDAGLYLRQDGTWGSLPYVSVSDVVGSTVTCEFEGSSITVQWYEFPNAGIVDVEIDGEPVTEIDQYGPEGPVGATTVFDGLAPEGHTIVLRVSGRQNPSSAGTTINVIDVVQDG